MNAQRKIRSRYKLSLKPMASLTLFLFLVTQVFVPIPASFAQSSDSKVAGGDQISVSMAQVLNGKIAVPSAFGEIEESFQGTSGKTILFIQDAHVSLEAQENIAKIIDKLVKDNGVKTVFEEGYEGPVPTDKFFGFIKDPKVKQKVSYFLLDKLRVGGAEYAHINRANEFKLIGVEDLKLYGENIQCYQQSSANRKDIEADLGELFSQITTLANQYFPKELKTCLKRKELFLEGKLSLLNYLKELRRLSLRGAPQGDAAISFSKSYPAISILLMAQTTRDQELIKQLNALDSRGIFEEILQLEQDISSTFLQNERDRDIFAYFQGLSLLKKLNRVELTQTEYETAKAALRQLDTQKLADFIVSLTHRSLVLSKEWEQHIKDAVRFYDVAQGRDRSIEDHLKQFLQSKHEDAAILVFGGFHTNGIKEIFKRQGLSYLIISPKITSEDKKHQGYYQQLMSVGHYSFEPPFFAARANRSPGYLYLAATGKEEFVRVELRAITSSVEAIGNNFDSQLIERLLASKTSLVRSEARESSKTPEKEKPEKVRMSQSESGVQREDDVFSKEWREGRLSYVTYSKLNSSQNGWLGWVLQPSFNAGMLIFHIGLHEQHIASDPWLDNLWKQGVFVKTLVPSFGKIASSGVKRALVSGTLAVGTLPEEIAKYITSHSELLQRYRMKIQNYPGETFQGRSEMREHHLSKKDLIALKESGEEDYLFGAKWKVTQPLIVETVRVVQDALKFMIRLLRSHFGLAWTKKIELRWVKSGFVSKRERNDGRIMRQVIQIETALGHGEQAVSKAEQVIADLNANKAKFKGEEVHVLDGTGTDAKVIGRIDRKIAEKYGYIHETANVVLLAPDGKVILQLRNKDNYDDHLAMYGGHLEVGESHPSSVRAETIQETGLDHFENELIPIGYESYDQYDEKGKKGDPNRERRSWFVLQLTEAEMRIMEEKKSEDEKLVGVSRSTDSREEYKRKLSTLWSQGRGEVTGVYKFTVDEITVAPQDDYYDPRFPEAKIRRLEVPDQFRGIPTPQKAFFTPDALDTLVSNTFLWDTVRKYTRSEVRSDRPYDLTSDDIVYLKAILPSDVPRSYIGFLSTQNHVVSNDIFHFKYNWTEHQTTEIFLMDTGVLVRRSGYAEHAGGSKVDISGDNFIPYKELPSYAKLQEELSSEPSGRMMGHVSSKYFVELNKQDNSSEAGNKAKSFLWFDRLGLKYPEGVAIHSFAVKAIAEGDEGILNNVVDDLRIQFPDGLLAVRSSPEVSMPGILETRTKVNADIEALRNAIRSVAKKEIKMGIIVQRMVFGDRNDKSATGVIFSRNPDTAEDRIAGSFLMKSQGLDLVSGKRAGVPIEQMVEKFPGGMFAALVKAAKDLEKIMSFPQEIEFTIDDGVLYFLQTRNIKFHPNAELKLMGENKSQSIPDFALVSALESIQAQLGNRKVYRYSDYDLSTGFKGGLASTPGAMRGQIVSTAKEARSLNELGKGAIVLLTPDNRHELDQIFKLPLVGLITTYGDMSSHEAVLMRLSGIPSIIHVGEDDLKKLSYGLQVIIDGDLNKIHNDYGSTVILTEDKRIADASFGIDIANYRKEFLRPYLAPDGRIKPEFSEERLQELNDEAMAKYMGLRNSPDKKAIFVANLEKHFLHELLLKSQETSKSVARRSEIREIDLGQYEWFQKITDPAERALVQKKSDEIFQRNSEYPLEEKERNAYLRELFENERFSLISDFAKRMRILEVVPSFSNEAFGHVLDPQERMRLWDKIIEVIEKSADCNVDGKWLRQQGSNRVRDFAGKMRVLDIAVEILDGPQKHRERMFKTFTEVLNSEGFVNISDSAERMKLLNRFFEIAREILRYGKYPDIKLDAYKMTLAGPGFSRITDPSERMKVLNGFGESERRIFNYTLNHDPRYFQYFRSFLENDGFVFISDIVALSKADELTEALLGPREELDQGVAEFYSTIHHAVERILAGELIKESLGEMTLSVYSIVSSVAFEDTYSNIWIERTQDDRIILSYNVSTRHTHGDISSHNNVHVVSLNGDIKNGKERKKIFDGFTYIKDLSDAARSEIAKAGARGKLASFGLLEALGVKYEEDGHERDLLYYPQGVSISPEAVQAISIGDTEVLDRVVDEIIRRFPSYGRKIADASSISESLLSARSSPPVSMPGILPTITNLGSETPSARLVAQHNSMIEELRSQFLKDWKAITDIPPESLSVRDQLKEALRGISKSWDSPQAKLFRERYGIPQAPGMGIIVQKMVFGNKNDKSATGVVFSRNPNTGEPGLFGVHKNKSQGMAIVSSEASGEDIGKMKSAYPEAFQALAELARRAEQIMGWPQEFEFTIESRELVNTKFPENRFRPITYILQMRPAQLSPVAQVRYMQEELKAGRKSLVNYASDLDVLQERLRGRRIYRVRPEVEKNIVGKGIASIPGAMVGRIVRTISEALALSRQGEAVIFIATPETREELLNKVFELPRVGVITTYGNDSAHESILLRMAGIPAIINVEKSQLRGLQSGEVVGIDGTANIIFTSEAKEMIEEDTTVFDASFGVDIPKVKKDFLKPFFNDDGTIKDEFTAERLELLNQAATAKYRQLAKEPDEKAAFTANLEKHFLHELLLKKQEGLASSLQRSEVRVGLETRVQNSLGTAANAEMPVAQQPKRLGIRLAAMPKTVVSLARADRMVRSVRKNVMPATVFVDAEDFKGFSEDQKEEYLIVAFSNKALRVVVYNQRGVVKDKLLAALLALDHVMETKKDLAGAQISFDRTNAPSIHLSKQILPSQELVRRLKGRVFFFKTQGQNGGTLAAALLWAWDEKLQGVSKGQDGFWMVAESLLNALQRSYDSILAFAVAA